MTSQTITIPAREVRPGDVLFGMTVSLSEESRSFERLWHYQFVSGQADLWVVRTQQVTVERPVPSDPLRTVRIDADRDYPDVFRKAGENRWYATGLVNVYTDADVADFPILWKPGMPIPTEGVQA